MIIHDAVESVKAFHVLRRILQMYPVLYCSQIVSKMYKASWLNTRKDNFSCQFVHYSELIINCMAHNNVYIILIYLITLASFLLPFSPPLFSLLINFSAASSGAPMRAPAASGLAA